MPGRPVYQSPRTDFGPAPPGYVAGIGRGAIGFSTRSDIGPARPVGAAEPTSGAGATLPLGRSRVFAAAAACGMVPTLSAEQIAKFKAEREMHDYSDSSYDSFAGYSHGLFDGVEYTEEDKEADTIYAAIEHRMQRKRPRPQNETETKTESANCKENAQEQDGHMEPAAKRPLLEEQFVDLKRKLGELSETDWANIPEHKDYSRRNRGKSMSRVKDKATPLPDWVVNSNRAAAHSSLVFAEIDAKQQKYGGLTTPHTHATSTGTATPLVSPMRTKLLEMKLDNLAHASSPSYGTRSVDPTGYLTDLQSLSKHKANQDLLGDVEDVHKARQLRLSVTRSNPTYAPGWIAAARFEWDRGNLSQARKFINQGCKHCPNSEEVWLEAAKMLTHSSARAALANAVKNLPKSVKIWQRACELEPNADLKKAVLRRALELVPRSEALWKALIDMEPPADARLLLARAVEQLPQCVDFWLALARLESYEGAQAVLNDARRTIPTEPRIWIQAAMLEEANGKSASDIELLLQKAIKSLTAQGMVIEREAWLAAAERAEISGGKTTCRAIVKATIGQGLDDLELEERRQTWLEDAERMVLKGSIETARAIHSHVLSIFPGEASAWLRAALFEKQHGTPSALHELLQTSVRYCPQSQELWLRWAKEMWLAGDVPAARQILQQANKAMGDAEAIWLAAAKLETHNNNIDTARQILQKARECVPTAEVWRRSAELEWLCGDRQRERELLTAALDKHPGEPKLWIMLAELAAEQKEYAEARQIFSQATKQCPLSVDLWIRYAELESAIQSSQAKARSILETARLKMPKNERLWLASVRLEQKAGQDSASSKVAGRLLAKALQECPKSGLLWTHAIASAAPKERKRLAAEAMKQCDNDGLVLCAAAKLLWQHRQRDQARGWFHRALAVAPDNGDVWAALFKFELENGSAAEQAAVVKRCVECEPMLGERWLAIKQLRENYTANSESVLRQVAQSMASADVLMLM